MSNFTPVAELDLPFELKKRLVKQGIVTAEQIQRRLADRPGWLRDDSGFRRHLKEVLKDRPSGKTVNDYSEFLPMVGGVTQTREGRASISTYRKEHALKRQHMLESVVDAHNRKDIPESFSLIDQMSPVRSQGSRGSCCGWGFAATRDLWPMSSPADMTVPKCQDAPGFQYDGSKMLDGHDGEGSQSFFTHLFARDYGCVSEEEYPYSDKASPNLEPHLSRALSSRITGFHDVKLDAEDIVLQPIVLKAMLSGNSSFGIGPRAVSVSVQVNPTWFNEYGLCEIDDDSTTGWHNLALVGYLGANDDRNPFGVDYFICKGSWGTNYAPDNVWDWAGYHCFPATYFTSSYRLSEAYVIDDVMS